MRSEATVSASSHCKEHRPAAGMTGIDASFLRRLARACATGCGGEELATTGASVSNPVAGALPFVILISTESGGGTGVSVVLARASSSR